MPKLVLFKMSELAATAASGIQITEAELLTKVVANDSACSHRSVQAMGGICNDYSGNIYITDYEQHVVMKVTESGELHVVAGLAGTSGSNTALMNVALADARFNTPRGICCDKSGALYIADTGNNQIRVIKNNRVSLYAGNGSGTSGLVDSSMDATQSRFNAPYDVCVDNTGVVYVADTGNHAIRKIWGGTVLTIAGDGSVADAWNVRASKYISFCSSPTAIDVDDNGNLYVWDSVYLRVKKIIPKGWVYNLSGSGVSGHSLGTGGTTAATSQAYTCTYTDLQFGGFDRRGSLYTVDKDASTGYSRVLRIDRNGVPAVVADLHTATTSYAGVSGVTVSPAQKIFLAITLSSEPASSSSSSSVDSSSSSESSSSSSVDSSSSSSSEDNR